MSNRRASCIHGGLRCMPLLAVVIMASCIFVKPASAAHDLTGYPKDKMTRIALEKVLTVKRPSGLGSVQGFTITDKYYILILLPPGQNDGNHIEIVRRSDNEVVTNSFNNPTYNLGHGNSATWNTRTNEIAVMDSDRKQLFLLSASDFKNTGTAKLYNSKNESFGSNGIAYDKERGNYYASGGGYIRTFGLDGHIIAGFGAKHNRVDQGLAYNKGYFYLPTWESAGAYDGSAYDNIFSKNTTVLYQFGRDGSFTQAYYIDNPLYEVEGMAFDENDVPYFVFNGPSGCYSIYKVTDYNLLSQLRQNYTISYFDNGGSGSPKEQNTYVGAEVTIPSIKPTRDGYTFLGWSTDKAATSASYIAGSKYIRPYGENNTNIKLYAVWQDNNLIAAGHDVALASSSNGNSASLPLVLASETKLEKDPASDNTSNAAYGDRDENISNASEDSEEYGHFVPTLANNTNALPSAGPSDMVVASIALISVGGGFCYWTISKRQLRALRKIARGRAG